MDGRPEPARLYRVPFASKDYAMRRLALSAFALSAFALAAFALLALAGSAQAAPTVAPAPAKPVDKDRLYLGVWHEVAQNPQDAARGCVAAETRFTTNDDGRLIDRDSCRYGDPNTGRQRIVEGPVSFPEGGDGTRFHTSHAVFGPFSAGEDYVILDHDPDYTWFIAASANFRDLSIFTRDPQVSDEAKRALAARAGELGYDITKLEYPPQPKA